MEIGYEELESLIIKRNFTKVLKKFEIKKDSIFLEKIEKYVEEFTDENSDRFEMFNNLYENKSLDSFTDDEIKEIEFQFTEIDFEELREYFNTPTILVKVSDFIDDEKSELLHKINIILELQARIIREIELIREEGRGNHNYLDEDQEVEFYKKKMGKKRAMNIMKAHLIKEN